MTTQNTPLASQSSTSGFRSLRTNRAARYVIAGLVLLAVSVTQLVVAVKDSTQSSGTADFVGGHVWQVAMAVAGLALVVGGMVMSRRH